MKERIIGAVVLVVFAVLVVPVFLDGPSSGSEIVSESVTLPGQEGAGRQQQTIVLQRDRSEPVPATTGSSPAQPEPERPAPVQAAAREAEKAPPQAPAPKPEAVEADDAPASATGMWAVQLGSFSDKDNAERLAADLRERGFAAFLSQVKTDAGAMQRVRIGPQKDRQAAEAIAAQLAKSGHSGQVVSHP